ncbi:MAG TPA: oligosaccharide flippase family protein [Steroidobacteraceae bacterium]|nr:oligosaccharide flippase family protein [Steroidobacteraceae bacterium]
MRPLIRDAAWVSASHVAAALTTLGVQVVLARRLETAVFGAYLLAQSMVNLVESTLMSRSGEVATYWLGRHWKVDFGTAHAYANYLAKRELRWNLTAAVLLAIVALVLQPHLGVDWLFIAVLALGIPLQSSYGVSKTLFVVAGRLRQQAAFEIGYSIVYVSISLVLVMQYGLWGFVIGYLVITLLKTVLSALWVRRFWPEAARTRDTVKPPALGLSTYSVLRNVSVNISQQADVIVLGIFASKEAVALYKIARTVASMPARLAGPVWSVLRPRVLTHLRDGDVRGVRSLLLRPALGLLIIGVVALPAALLWMDDLLGFVYGAQYVGAGGMAVILLVGVWVLFGLSGWMGFVAVVTSNKVVATGLFVLQALAVLIAGFIARDSGVLLAILMSGAMVLIGALAWMSLHARSPRFALLRL